MKISRGNTISQIGKHFGVIAILKLSTFCTTLYSTTYKGRLSSHIYYNWHEILFSPITHAVNAHRSPADLTQYLFY